MPHTISDDDLSLSLLSSETDTPIKLADSESLDVSYDICYDNIIKIHEYFDKDLEDQKEFTSQDLLQIVESEKLSSYELSAN
ncbi:hypothetical protein CWI36_0894p0020 [Hamiltosporidium magnivora]|uniref:Uncharacterized protein n=1 Tax=Hamiltosporidium magnivora TaxID=148818 RepID=A0A4Q9L9G4_9MICR|nr:hypothetical protein CWI36_0894p0020 [Hamiltosporidium magnivora]